MPRLVLASLLLAGVAAAEPYAVGDTIEGFSLEDQHGAVHDVDGRVRVIFFSRDMDGGELLEKALADRDPEFLNEISAVLVADISGMPRLIARLFALPSMRKRPYPMLLDRDGDTTASLPDVEDQATVILLKDLRVVRVDHYASEEALAESIAKLSEGS